MPSLQGLAGITVNPVLSDGIAGLATSATAQATVEVRCVSTDIAAYINFMSLFLVSLHCLCGVDPVYKFPAIPFV